MQESEAEKKCIKFAPIEARVKNNLLQYHRKKIMLDAYVQDERGELMYRFFFPGQESIHKWLKKSHIIFNNRITPMWIKKWPPPPQPESKWKEVIKSPKS